MKRIVFAWFLVFVFPVFLFGLDIRLIDFVSNSSDTEILSNIRKNTDLLKQTDDSTNETILYIAVGDSRDDLVEKLILLGADPNVKTAGGETSLHRAAAKANLNLVRLLLKHKADPNIEENAGLTPLEKIFYSTTLSKIKSTDYCSAAEKIIACLSPLTNLSEENIASLERKVNREKDQEVKAGMAVWLAILKEKRQ